MVFSGGCFARGGGKGRKRGCLPFPKGEARCGAGRGPGEREERDVPRPPQRGAHPICSSGRGAASSRSSRPSAGPGQPRSPYKAPAQHSRSPVTPPCSRSGPGWAGLGVPSAVAAALRSPASGLQPADPD